MVFKLTNSIKDEHETTLARLELESLLGNVEPVKNFFDIIQDTPLKHFSGDSFRVQDILTYEPCYGEYQGFYGWVGTLKDVSNLARRLAYFREFLVVTKDSDADRVLAKSFPDGKKGKNVQVVTANGYTLVRIVTDLYYLEKSFYISKLSRNREEIDRNVKTLFEYPFRELYRIPASVTMAVGKRLQDYFTIREEQSLYLTHVWHPYKGKFHSRMVRALLNYVSPNENAKVLDNWTGSGTLNVEATLMGLDNIGLEINPLSVLMSNVKCQSLNPEFLDGLDARVESFLSRLKSEIQEHRTSVKGTVTLTAFAKTSSSSSSGQSETDITKEAGGFSKKVKGLFPQESIEEFLVARNMIRTERAPVFRNLLLLSLSGSISDLARRRKGGLMDVLPERLWKLMYLRLYLFHSLNAVLGIRTGDSATYVSDTRDPFNHCFDSNGKKIQLEEEAYDGIVTSPPYSTALDYIRNDLPQLTILGLVKDGGSLEDLEKVMMGNPNLRYYDDDKLTTDIEKRSGFYEALPTEAKESISRLRKAGRVEEAVRTYKFFHDLYLSLISMNKLLKIGAKCAIIVGNNHYKVDEEGEPEEVKNDIITEALGRRTEVGFERDLLITRPLEKTQAGYIRNESVVILRKVKKATNPVI